MAKEDETGILAEKRMADIEHVKRRLDMFDQRLDNIDSVVTAAVERIVNQPISINMTCPHCGKNMEIAIIGSHKPTR
ncbi:hypothetical protein ACFLTZ_03060 [Chloroflexota bacterium]